MKSQIKSVFFVLFCVLTFQSIGQQNAKGSLFIIGGGEKSDALIKQMVDNAHLTAEDYIIVLPMASAQPDTGFINIQQQLQLQTKAVVRNFNFSKHDVNDKQWIDSLSNAKLIYILGGDQSRFMQAVLKTPVYAAIRKAFEKGSTVAGTSAGAAVMSKYMITGRQLTDTVYKETFDKLWDGNIEFAEGLGLLQHTIIDQHFLKRSRYSRLITALGDKPGYVCIGIDEGTAIITHGNKATVAGSSQVVRFANPIKVTKTSKGLLKFDNINLGIFTSGDIIDIKP
jgi:cyanophycinase